MKFFAPAFVFGVLFVAAISARPSENINGKRLIKIAEDLPAQWMTEKDIFVFLKNGVRFVDVTDAIPSPPAAPLASALPTTLRHQTTVRKVLPYLQESRLESFVRTFSSFPNRYYNNQNGVNASNWLISEVVNSILAANYKGNTSVEGVDHAWTMDSVVARIEGSDPELQAERVIMGAHMDSINGANPTNGVAPGADDNASGSATILEAFRAILEAGIIPKRSIEFHWYSAEEVGLRGSGDIAKDYLARKVPVVSMVNFDVVGYLDNGKTSIAIMTDYTTPALNAFLRLVVDEYLTVGWKNYVCGYGCSDHVSWSSNGFNAASPIEPLLSPLMHGTRDTIETVSFPQVLEFAKLAAAYAIEVAEPAN